MKNGDNKKYSGSEVYYWNGKKLTSASDFMKGYDDWYEKTAKALVGEENLKDISTIKYKYNRSYLYTDGTTKDADSGNVTQ